ncbi:MAG: GxxExxY protein [Vicinamibacterales bacterium]
MHDGLHASLTEQIIGCAMEVHRQLGPGLLESIYESALCFELRTAGMLFKRQIGVPLFYKGMLLSEHRPDLVVAEAVIVEVKAVDRLDEIHMAQMLTYLRVTGLHIGLILNFNSAVLKHGVRRVILCVTTLCLCVSVARRMARRSARAKVR